MRPEISIIIPTYNTAAMTLALCRALCGAGVQIIVVDDASTDGTSELLRTEPVTVYGKVRNEGERVDLRKKCPWAESHHSSTQPERPPPTWMKLPCD